MVCYVPHCHPRLPRANLEIPLINWNALENQLSQRRSCCFIDQNLKYFLHNQIWWSKSSGTYLNQKQPVTGVYSRLQKKGLFMSIFLFKVVGLQFKKDSPRVVLWWVYLTFWNTFFATHVLVMTASAKCQSFSLLRQPHLQNIALDLGYVLIIFK